MSFTIQVNTLEAVEEFLQLRSYVEGFKPTQADVKLFGFVGAAPDAAKYPNIARWYSHIKSFSEGERKKWPAEKNTITVSGKAAAAPAAAEEEDEDVDLFGEETEEDKALKKEREEKLKKEKDAGKQKGGKSSILLDIKPWDSDTDMKVLEKEVRAIDKDGLKWGASKLVDVAFGVKKLQMLVTIVDELVGSEDLEDWIVEGLSDYVQSMDIVAWNKV